MSLVDGSNDAARVLIETYNSYRLDEELTELFWNRDHPPEKCRPIEIGSKRVGAVISCHSGQLLSIWRDGTQVDISQTIVLYDATNSGAYLFRPTGEDILRKLNS